MKAREVLVKICRDCPRFVQSVRQAILGGLSLRWIPVSSPSLPTNPLQGWSCRDAPGDHILVNIYGPYTNWKGFWDWLDSCGLLFIQSVILAGDLNLTMEDGEIWGQKSKKDPLSGYFKDLFTNNSLKDIIPCPVSPTWRNGRCGAEGISKRLDRFLVHLCACEKLRNTKSWTFFSETSDHATIFLSGLERRNLSVFHLNWIACGSKNGTS